MKTNRKRVPSWAMILVWLLCAVLLGGCGPLVRIEEVRPAAHTTAFGVPTTPPPSGTTGPSGPVTPTTALPTGSVPNGTTEPTVPAVTTLHPTPGETAEPTSPTSSTTRSPGIVVESDEIVPVPDSLVMDFNEALDALIAGIGQWEEPDAAALETP